MPLVSVIIPVYNSARYLKECLNSVFSQTFKDFEIVLVDDGSEDESAKVYNSFDDKRLRIYRQGNKGVASARNFAMSLALGEFIACLDADDSCRPDRLERQYDFMSRHPGYSLVGSYCNVIDAEGNFIYVYNRIPRDDAEIRQYMRHDNPIITSAAFFKKKDAVAVGGFYDEIRTRSEDFPLWAKLAKLGGIYNVPEPLVEYRVVPSSLSAGLDNLPIRKLFLNLAHHGRYTEQEKELYMKLTQINRPVQDNGCNYYLSLAKLYLFDGGNREAAMVNLCKAIKLNPKALKAYAFFFFVLFPGKFNKSIKDCYIKFFRKVGRSL